MRRLPKSLLGVALLLLVAVESVSAPVFKRGVVTLLQADRRVVVQVEVADSPEARARGLMFRTHLPENHGMLFLFEAPQRLAFWMKNTRIPLSIAFIDTRWRIVDIQDMDPPQPGAEIPIYVSRAPAQYALEVNQGFFRRWGITTGARVIYRPLP